MTKEQLEWIKIRISNLITNTKNDNEPCSDWDRTWNAGYNSACEQILEMLEKTEEE